MDKKIFTTMYSNEELAFMELRYSNSNKHYQKHFHETFSLGANKEGRSVYTNRDNKYILEKDKLSIINPYDVHSCNSTSEILNKYYMMYLDVSWCEKIQKTLDSNITCFKNLSQDFLDDEEFYTRFINLCNFIYEENSILEKENELLNFYFDFFSLFILNTNKTQNNEKFESIRIFLEENYKENFSLDELSDIFKLNSFYIIRLFKLHINMTPHTYLLNIKINKSKILLKEGMSIVSTALECGFYDQSHFHRNFVKFTATTPKEFQLNFVQ